MNKLRKALLMNSASCILFGFIFLIFPTQTNEFIGNSASWLIQGIVASLIIAATVGLFGYLQIVSYKQVCQNA